MQIKQGRLCGIARAASLAILAGLVGGCAGQSGPAPVYFRGSGEPMAGPMPMAPPPAPALQVVVKRGQTLDGYAYTYHVPRSAIIAANGLRPPYELKAGQRLTIPNMHGPVQQAMTSPPAMRPWPPTPMPMQQAAIPQPPPSPQTVGVPSAGRPPQTIFSAQPAATPTQPMPPQAAAPPPQPVTPPPSAAKYMPDIIPLDGPAPKEAQAAPPPKPASLAPPPQTIPLGTAPQLAAPPAAAAPVAQANAQAAPGGRFPWPVRGRILAGYGNSPGGGHNEGINIAAPAGTPVRAIDSGTVVYSGNEVKGYGNIVLIRHADGWISAYAHLSDVDVRQGETISTGQVIAKVGNSGGVSEPQLHFELRRGQKPVNPTEFLAPAPSAEGAGSRAG